MVVRIMYGVILAGGSGTRLWPISRENYPKQFMEIVDGKSLIQLTAERFLETIGNNANILVNTNNDYKFHCINHLNKYGINKLIVEPCRRNTAPAIALIIKYLLDIEKVKKDDVVFVAPSDHIINPIEDFKKYILEGEKLAKQGNIILFGIKPNSPETGYGYIKIKNNSNDISEFKEKPDLKTAQQYLLSGEYFWNSGMFMFSIQTILDEFAQHCPDLSKSLKLSYDDFIKNFDKLQDISIDYAIMEKTDKSKLIPMNIVWSDVGNWDSIYETTMKDSSNNSIKGNVIVQNTKNSLIWTEESSRLVAVNGLNDLLVVDTHDALYITKKGDSQLTKDIVKYLKDNKFNEIKEHITTYRPWGSYTVLMSNGGYKIKKICVNPGEKLSLQMHYHRSEHWVIVKGTAEIVCSKDINDIKTFLLSENESIYIPKTYVHRLTNSGKEALEIIEVQVGSYLEENDIVRFEDTYGR